MYRRQELLEKLKEAAASVLPISLIVLAICFVLVPVDTGLMLSFVLATALLILGMGLFTLGAEMSMSKIGNYIGAKLTKSRKLWLILVVSFLLGVAITVAEPDLQVLAANVPEIDKTVLILTVSVGVGIFLMLCMVRIFFWLRQKLRCVASRPSVDGKMLAIEPRVRCGAHIPKRNAIHLDGISFWQAAPFKITMISPVFSRVSATFGNLFPHWRSVLFDGHCATQKDIA